MSDDHAAQAPAPLRPVRSHEEEPTSSPVTACRRCRRQKLRCSRDLPACKRCKDISAICDYPPPPDRKFLASQRLQNSKTRACRESESPARLQEQHKFDHTDGARAPEAPSMGGPVYRTSLARSDLIEEHENELGGQSAPEGYQISTPLLQTALKKAIMPSPEVAMFLIEIYFSRLYNAHLLFHKETFLADFVANKVPDFVALAIFASASIFLRRIPGKSQQGRDGDGEGAEIGISMLSAAGWTRQGDDWANAACQRVLMQADVPRIEIVQGCEVLGLYWWAIGERERTHVHFQIAYMNVRLLGLHVQSKNINVRDSLQDEIKRRCFWGCWINQCVGQENASFKAEPWKDAIGLKFPSDEHSWHAGQPKSTEMFDEKGDIVSFEGSEIPPIASEMGELVKLISTWWEIQRFVTQPGEETSYDASRKIAGLLELDRQLGKYFDNFHPDLQYINPTTFASPKVDKYRLFSLHCVYRASYCVLHSSVVPLFANTTTNPYIPKKAVRLSVEESLKHSAVILDMVADFMSTRPDISRLPSMVGFTMFVASTIQFKSLGAQRKLQTYGTGRFKAAIVLLSCLKEYWDSAQGLWSSLKSMFAPAGIDIDTIPTDPYYYLNLDDQNTDLDKIVSQEGTPDGPVLHTYVATQEAKGASPRPDSDTYSHTRRTKSAQNTPSPGSVSINPEDHQEQEATLPIHNRHDGQISANAQTVVPKHQHSNSQPSNYQQACKDFEQQAFRGASYIPRRSISAVAPSPFVPLGTVPEGYQTENPSAGMPYGIMGPESMPDYGQTMSTFGKVDGVMGTEMNVDMMDFWWDQSYGALDIEVIDPNARVDGGAYPFENFSFDY